MSLRVVGTGFGRTGTKSLKLALELLGFGPCHHMMEVRKSEALLRQWRAAADGVVPDWDVLFKDFQATVDWPAARFWREICAHYPEAKVVHSLRPADKWVESMYRTIHPSIQSWAEREPGANRDRGEMAYKLIAEQTFGGRLGEREHAISVYEAHTEDVRRTIAEDRLLMFDAAEGWGPLCRFLEVDVPDEPYPHVNTAAEFNKRRSDEAQADAR